MPDLTKAIVVSMGYGDYAVSPQDFLLLREISARAQAVVLPETTPRDYLADYEPTASGRDMLAEVNLRRIAPAGTAQAKLDAIAAEAQALGTEALRNATADEAA